MADKNLNATINVDFEESTSRQSLNSGDSLPTLFGKVKKFFSDLKTVCFSGSYNDLSDKPTTATTEVDGLMSAEDKTKLDNIDDTYALKSLYGDTTINVGRKAETKVGYNSTAEGYNTTASGNYSHAEGFSTTASGNNSHAEGDGATASGERSHAEGRGTASGFYAHAEGRNTTASGNDSHAEGAMTTASSYRAHAEGNNTTASGDDSHAEGESTTANGCAAHAEGYETTASGDYSHAEGKSYYKVTELIADFLKGNTTKDDIINAWNTKKFSVAHGKVSHVEGQDNLSLGNYSHAEGLYTVAIGNQSHTSGYYTKALHDNEAAYGKYNESNDNTLFSIGDGTADDARHNAFEITTTGGKLHDKDIATTDLIPTTLPANGGDAATVNGHTVESNVPALGYYYATCDSPLTTNIKTVTCEGFEFKEGARITVCFTTGSGGNPPSTSVYVLKINEDAGRPIAYNDWDGEGIISEINSKKSEAFCSNQVWDFIFIKGRFIMQAPLRGYQMDDTLSNSSRNPVQNKIIKQAIDNKADKSLYGDTTINVGRKAGTTVGKYSTAEGYETTASGDTSHAEGNSTTASGTASHAEGYQTTASGICSHTEG